MLQTRIIALALLALSAFLGWRVYTVGQFHLGLDLAGGTQLVYQARTGELASADRASSMQSLRDTIERRINVFGVAEPLVQTQGEDRLIVELPGITDTQAAIEMIGKTPVLEFRLEETLEGTTTVAFAPTGLTGKYLKRANVEFGAQSSGMTNEPIVSLQFNDEGAKLFAQITKEHVGEVLGIFLDGQLLSNPVIREEIPNGQATVSGNFTPEEARTLVRDLNYGALPVGIDLLSAQTVGANLGATAVAQGAQAGLIGVGFVALFLIVWYRLPGLVASVALGIYIVFMLALFKLIPVTLTAAGIAGFIVSIGMAVDANVLIFARMKEELAEGGTWTHNAIKNGFSRAWPSIRDGNMSSIFTAVILFWFGTSLVKGFALVFGLGVIVSMLTAITFTRTFLLALGDYEHKGVMKFLLGSGFKQ